MLERWIHGLWPRPGRILLAEDDAELRALVALSLRRDRHEVVELEDGEALFRYFESAALGDQRTPPPDLVVSDVRMPVFAGIDVLRALRDAAIDTPVILVTAFGDPEIQRTAFELDATFLAKPFTMESLRLTVSVILAGTFVDRAS